MDTQKACLDKLALASEQAKARVRAALNAAERKRKGQANG